MTLKIKWSVILPAKNGFVWEQQRIAIQDKQAIAKAVGKSNKGKGVYGEKEESREWLFRTKVCWRKVRVSGEDGFSLVEFL